MLFQISQEVIMFVMSRECIDIRFMMYMYFKCVDILVGIDLNVFS